MELDELRGTADELRSKTESLQRTAAPLEDSMSRLTERAAAIEGALEHALDRVPGLSAEDARERAQNPPPIEIT
ncbi:MAG: hypothetical protein M3Q53_06015 [Actinomycetota bacterium]|nr:hypothetical protein [Actinomycetota bacterium]